jgi:hypothetical protein
MDYKSIISTAREKIKSLFSEEFEELNIPSGKDKEEMVDYIRALYEDSIKWRKTSFKKRFQDETDPVEFWKKCRKLRNNLHWKVWGRRGLDLHEMTNPVIADQLRVRKTYLTSNYHDIVLNPNIKNIDQVIRQERDDTKWGDFVDKLVDVCLTDGTVISKEILDKSQDEYGIERSVVCDTESIYPTPEVTSFEAIDGCWYLIDATMQNLHSIVRDFPDLDVTKIKETAKSDQDRNKYDEEKKFYDKTQFVEVLTAYIDDNKLEPIPFDEEEFNRRTALIHQGQEPEILDTDNHKEYMKRYLDWLENTVVPQTDNPDSTPEDQQFVKNIVDFTLLQVDEHAQYNALNPTARRKKYPNGRRVIVVGDQIAEDGDNPMGVPWRKLYNILQMEKDPHSIWGRGIPEIMWEENYNVDLMESRIADMSVTASMPEKWMNINDKEVLAQQNAQYNNNPKEIKWFASTPPIITQGRSVQEFITLLTSKLESLQQKIGVNETSLGGSPSAHASGDLVELLLRQSMTLISGDVNKNLNEFMNQVMETKLALYKKFYKLPKYYMIDGIPTALKVSDMLSKMTVIDEDGNTVEKDIPIIQIRVRPNSNFPNQWENDIAFALQTMKEVGADGMPLVPKSWIMSIFAQRYPEFAPGGKFYEASKAEELGLQTMKEQQAKQQSDAETLQQVGEKFKSAGLKTVMGDNQIQGGTNAA